MQALNNCDYKSKAMLFGLPLVHVATGRDPSTGRKRIAKGIIAVGNVAVGALAIGGFAVGGVTVGGVSLRVISIGGLSVGILLAIGGCALGAGLSAGGLAVSTIAVGGMAVGCYAIGVGVAGIHTLSGAGVDLEVGKLIRPSAIASSQWLMMIAFFLPISCLIVSVILAVVFLTKTSARQVPQASLFSPPHERKSV
jgi:hypothetical protein